MFERIFCTAHNISSNIESLNTQTHEEIENENEKKTNNIDDDDDDIRKQNRSTAITTSFNQRSVYHLYVYIMKTVINIPTNLTRS